jgi:ribonuclease P protein component
MRGNPGSPPEFEVAAGARLSGDGQAPLRRGGEPRDESLPSHERLRKRADYLRCYRTGRRRTGALVILYIAANSSGHPRMGITATRKVGNSVVRHRLKRWIKEIYRRWPERGRLAAVDLVVHLKPEVKTAGHGEVEHDLRRLLLGVARGGAAGGPGPAGAPGGQRGRGEAAT